MMHTSRQTSRDELLQGINPISCPASFYRTTLFHDVGGVDSYGNDFELFMNMSVGNEIVPVDAVLGEFRIHGASETGNLKSYIRTLKLDAEVITKHSKRYFFADQVALSGGARNGNFRSRVPVDAGETSKKAQQGSGMVGLSPNGSSLMRALTTSNF